MLVCERCGTASPTDSQICRRCFASLEGAQTVDAASVPVPGRRWLDLSWPSTNRGWAALVLGVLALVVAVWWVPGWLAGPPDPFPAMSGARTVATPGDAWGLPIGSVGGTRRTDAVPALDAKIAWSWIASSAPSTSLVSDGEAVYVGLEEGVLVSIAVSDGVERWRAPVPGVLESAPAYADGRLYLGYRSGSVTALDAETGDTLWETQIGLSISTTPVVVDGIVFVAANGAIGGFDAEDGTLFWHRPIDDSFVPVTPVVDENTLVVATFDEVLLFDRSNGELLTWARFAPQFSPLASVAIEDELIVATADGQLMAIETSMRRPWWDGVRPMWEFLHVIGAAPNPPWRPDRWTVDTPPEAYPAAVVGDLVLLASPSGIVRAHAREDGAVVWETNLEAITAAPVMTGSGLLLGGVRTTWLLDLADGSTRDEISVDGDLLDLIPVESGTFVLTSDGIDWRPVDVGE